jgi:DNA-binding CsgD family transcriptional regulator
MEPGDERRVASRECVVKAWCSMTDLELQALVRKSLLNVARAERALEQARLHALRVASYAVARLSLNAETRLQTEYFAAKSGKTPVRIAGICSVVLWIPFTSKYQSYSRNLEHYERAKPLAALDRTMATTPLVADHRLGFGHGLSGKKHRDSGFKRVAYFKQAVCEPIEHRTIPFSAQGVLAQLTPRQRQIMDMVLNGKPSKVVAFDLGISRRTVENHRASIMRKTRSESIPALARLAFAANLEFLSCRDEPVQPVQLSL